MRTKKKKLGRPKGGVSFASVTLAELNATFGPNQPIPVGRVFLEKNIPPSRIRHGIHIIQPIGETMSLSSESPKVEMQLSR